MFSMILARMRWMDENGVRQWNATEYDRAYPLEYYMDEQYRGRIFALASVPADEIACAAILKEEDERWTDDAPALYIHNFVSGIGAGGAGARFIESAGEYARRLGKEYLRLDSAENNAALSAYYERQGFLPAGECTDGPYRGVLRQKRIL